VVNPQEILDRQRTLRARFFEGPQALRWRPARDLAAQLLLYLDDPQACWRLTTEWVRQVVDADRVDGGFGGFGHSGSGAVYVVMAESQRATLALPSVVGARFDARDPGLQVVWRGQGISPIEDVQQDRMLSDQLRGTLLNLGTRAKLAIPLRDGDRPVGLLCADWLGAAPRWHAETCIELGELGRNVLGPALAVAGQIAAARRDEEVQVSDAGHSALARELGLTPAELKVARLIATGLSYKEVARILGRSLSTVDHQLRSLRDKLGVSSTAKLVHLINERFDGLRD
jgi:DNA-binding CsgD family transcriptional regulator